MQRKNCPKFKENKEWVHFLDKLVPETLSLPVEFCRRKFSVSKKKTPNSHIQSVAPPCGSNISLQMIIVCFLARNLSAVLKDCRLKTRARHRSKLIAPKCSTTAEEKRKEMKEENK